ncbi:MAG: DegV family protein [Eubacterium sp.]|nr:DegV family protein [Eubacterium sp.]
MNIKITADSTCDLSPGLTEKYGIQILPLYIVKEGKSYKDMEEIVPQDIFDHVSAGGDITSTAAINADDYINYFKPLSEQYDAVIHIDISSDFSSCYQNACIAANEFENVYVIDSRNLSTGSGLLVLEAAEMAQAGESAEKIVNRLNNLALKVEASFVIDKLDYLRKGGRCSALAALGANLLSLRPCIEVVDGKMKVGKKYRGNFEKCIDQYVKERLEGRFDISKKRIFITHTPTAPGLADAVRRAIVKYVQFDEILETNAGCTVSSHCGPSTLGILFIRE